MAEQDIEKKPKKSHLAAVVAAVMVVVVAALAALCALQVRDVERGTVEAVAVQQDGYVQLVVDQIALKGDRADKEIVEDILGTLDANSGSYWALSKDQTMLFVKDSTETTRYRNLTADSYFDTVSASEFISRLGSDRVIHEVVDINGQPYVASGTLFSYRGNDYRLCLLTNRDILLESSAMLGARSRLQVLLFFVLALLFVIPVALAVVADKSRNKLAQSVALAEQARDALGRVNRRVALLDTYDARGKVWKMEMLPKFERSLRERGVPASRLHVRCASDELCERFLAKTAVSLGRKAVRFSDGGNTAVLLLIGDGQEQLEQAVKLAVEKGVSLDGLQPVSPTDTASATMHESE